MVKETAAQWVSATEAAEIAGVKPRTMRELAMSGTVAARKVPAESGGNGIPRWRLSRTSLDRYVADVENRRKPPPKPVNGEVTPKHELLRDVGLYPVGEIIDQLEREPFKVFDSGWVAVVIDQLATDEVSLADMTRMLVAVRERYRKHRVEP